MTDCNERVKLLSAYNPDSFRELGYRIVDRLTDYLKSVTAGNADKVLPSTNPQELLSRISERFLQTSQENYENIIDEFITWSQHVHHPGYIGHQFAPVIPQAALCEFVSAFVHNSAAVFEMGPVSTCMEKVILRWMADYIGYNNQAGGFLTSGGSLGNLTALLAARQAKTDYDISISGYNALKPLAVMVSELSHYSISRACKIMGLGENAIYPVPVTDNYCIDNHRLKDVYQKARQDGRHVFAFVANAGSTPTGGFDDLKAIGDFCQTHDLWLHVDGAHGAPVLLSPKYKYLLEGVEQADSVIWDLHKMMLMPCIATGLIFKDQRYSYENFSQKASYLFQENSYDEWYNLAQQTIECTKPSMSLKIYTCLTVLGVDFFETYVTYLIDLTKKMTDVVQQSEQFELAAEAQCNIFCFRYKGNGNDDQDALQSIIRQKILEQGSFYITQTRLDKGMFLRCTVMNPYTTLEHFQKLLNQILHIVADLNVSYV